MDEHNDDKAATQAIMKLKRLFEWPPLLAGEDGRQRDALEASIRETIQPADAFEEIWTAESVALQWEICGLRRQRAAIINTSMKPALAKIFECVGPYEKNKNLTRAEQAEILAEQWFADKESRKSLRVFLDRFDLDPLTAMQAQALASRLPEIETIHRMITSLMRQRDAVWQQLYGRREKVGQQRAQTRDLKPSSILSEPKVPQLEHNSSVNGQ